MLPAHGLYGHIRNNNIKSALLLAGFVVLVFLVWMAGTLVWSVVADRFQGIGIRLNEFRNPTEAELMGLTIEHWLERSFTYAYVPVIVAGAWFAFAYVSHSRLIRNATGAHAVSRTLDYRLYNLVENLTIAAGMPMPRIEVIETDALNAYASGLSPSTATVAVTRGLIDTLNDDELEAVLAHEITHIRNRDVRLMVIATIFVGILAYVSQMMRRQASHDGVLGRSTSGTEFLLIVLAAVIASVAAFFGLLSHFALSRSREYLADAGSAELTKNPEALISALQRIQGHDEIEDLPPSMAAMMISSRFDGLFATHPPVEERVSALQRFAGARETAVRVVARQDAAQRAAVSQRYDQAALAPHERSFGKRKAR